MTEVVTASGFVANVDEEAVGDLEFLETLREVKKDPTALIDLSDMVLGEEGTKALKQHLKEANGRARIEDFDKALRDILIQMNIKKKS